MKTENIIRQIAKAHGVSPAEVKMEIQFAIQEAMKSDDPVARSHWEKISPNGEEPTIEQFLSYIVNQIKS